MKKEEFPTFLNEQPTVVFGRTTRELLIILIGLTGAYVVWTNSDAFFPGNDIGFILIKGLLAAVPLIGSIVVAFIKVASRPLEEWATIGAFFLLTPKVYLYMPLEDSGENDHSISAPQYQTAGRGIDEEDEY